MSCTNELPVKAPAEAYPIVIDFTPKLGVGETLTGTPTVAIEVIAGVDINSATVLNGAPTLAGTTGVTVGVQNGLTGCWYQITATCVTSAGRTLSEYAVLPVSTT